jgi:uncharacterized protein (DUF58 family)
VVAATLRQGWERALQVAERRLPALTRYRHPEALPIELHARRIYVLPTAFGILFGCTLVVMLLGALNFNNNAALLLTFALAGATMVSLHRTVGHLNRLRLVAVRAEPVFAGDDIELGFHFACADARPRLRLRIGARNNDSAFDLGPDGGIARLAAPTQRRGWLAVGRHKLATSYPFGLFRAWSVLHPEQQVLVHPRPEPGAPPLPRSGAREGGAAATVRGEDWHGLREYRVGDPLRSVAWKPSARQDRLLVKEFIEPRGDEITLEWSNTGLADPEARIARLTRWVLDASAQNLSFSLVLPEAAIGPSRGQEHVARCLRELALLP